MRVGAVVDLEPGPCPDGWEVLDADVRVEADVERAVAAAVERFGQLDVVVANAGVVPPWSDTADLDLDALDDTLAVNVRGVATTLKHGARALRGRGGSIVVTASMNAWHAAPAQGAYTASKHAVLGLVRTAAMDLGADGIRVNAIAPGPIATEAFRDRLLRREAEGGLSGRRRTSAGGRRHCPRTDGDRGGRRPRRSLPRERALVRRHRRPRAGRRRPALNS